MTCQSNLEITTAIRNDLEWSGSDLISSLKRLRNQRKTYSQVVGVLAEIRTEDLSHTSLERYS
jgi:hypothetical protein